jgi:hypothetical protein
MSLLQVQPIRLEARKRSGNAREATLNEAIPSPIGSVSGRIAFRLAAPQHNPHNVCMKLSLEPDPAPTPVNNTPTVLEGIVRQRCLSTTYNRTRMIIAPHILYTRHDALYVDAVVVSREGMLPREEKVGTFKLDGLKDLTVLERAFSVSTLFDAGQDKYVGETLMAVDPDAAAAAA